MSSFLVSIRRQKRKVASVSLAILFAGALILYGIAEPRTPIGHVVFHTGYLFPPTRPLYLRFLSRSLREFEGGYVPPAIDQFLIDRLWQCRDSPEWKAIVDFEVYQTSARWGMAMFSPWFSENDQEKGEVIRYLISKLDKYESGDSASAMVLIEALRQNKALTKCDISGIHLWDAEHNRVAWPSDRRAQAMELFRRWWDDGRRWPGNRSEDPLKGSPFAIYSWGG